MLHVVPQLQGAEYSAYDTLLMLSMGCQFRLWVVRFLVRLIIGGRLNKCPEGLVKSAPALY